MKNVLSENKRSENQSRDELCAAIHSLLLRRAHTNTCRTIQPNNIESAQHIWHGRARRVKEFELNSKPHCHQSVMCLSFACCFACNVSRRCSARDQHFLLRFFSALVVILKCKLLRLVSISPELSPSHRRGKL
jgi:hypothetical protein